MEPITFSYYLCRKNNYDEESVQAIIQWAEFEHIHNTSLYVRANINDIKQYYPDAFYNPAIERLYQLKEFTEKAAQ